MSESRVRTYETNYSNNFIAWNFLKIRKSLSLSTLLHINILILFVSFLTIYTNTSHIFSKNNYRRIQNFSYLWKTFISISIFPPKLFRLFPKYSGWHLIIYEIIQPRAKIHNFFFPTAKNHKNYRLKKSTPRDNPFHSNFHVRLITLITSHKEPRKKRNSKPSLEHHLTGVIPALDPFDNRGMTTGMTRGARVWSRKGGRGDPVDG